jgi:hypothetical protein
MSDELAQDENDAADYDLETMYHNEDEEESTRDAHRTSQAPVQHVVFDITQDDAADSEEEHPILPK